MSRHFKRTALLAHTALVLSEPQRKVAAPVHGFLAQLPSAQHRTEVKGPLRM